MADGSRHAVVLQGVGCTEAMCSRVRVGNPNAGGVWLDELASIRDLAPAVDGSQRVVFTFRNGSSHEASIDRWGRVLYIGSRAWTHRVDLAGVRQIDFE